jgi:serine/threonine protein kinase
MAEAVADSTSLVGQCFAERYELEARIGTGAAGETYRARHAEQPRKVVVKVFHDDVTNDAGRQRRFEMETSKLAALAHPSMPEILAFGVHGGRRFVVREWLEGETLADRLARGPLSLNTAMTIARQLLAALAAAHATQLIHRHVHPGNVFLEARKHGGARVKLLDFAPDAGVARKQATPYRAPEDGAGEASARSDVFSVGALVAAMLQAANRAVSSAVEDRPAKPSEAHAAQGALASAAVVAVLSTAAPGSAATAEAARPAERAPDQGGQAAATAAEATRASTKTPDSRIVPAGTRTATAPGANAQASIKERALPTAAVVSAFETAFAPPVVASPEPTPAPAPESEHPLLRWIGRATSTDRFERFDDAADMLSELVDRLPRELRIAAEETSKIRRAPLPLEPAQAAAADDSIADTHNADFDEVRSQFMLPKPHSPRMSPQLAATPAPPPSTAEALPEVAPVALHGPGEPGMAQLTAATAIGAFAFAAIVIVVMPGELGLARRATTTPITLAAAPAAPALPARAEPRREALTTPIAASPIPLSAIAPIASAPATKPRLPAAVPAPAAAKAPLIKLKPMNEARDPWADPLPKELQRFRASALNGSPGDKAAFEELRGYNREHAKDARGYLITARFYLNRLWRSDAVGQYTAAIERDSSVRGAPEILPALLECVAEGKAAPAAEALIEKVYGTGAQPAIDRALDKAKSQTVAVRLSTLSEKLLAKAP